MIIDHPFWSVFQNMIMARQEVFASFQIFFLSFWFERKYVKTSRERMEVNKVLRFSLKSTLSDLNDQSVSVVYFFSFWVQRRELLNLFSVNDHHRNLAAEVAKTGTVTCIICKVRAVATVFIRVVNVFYPPITAQCATGASCIQFSIYYRKK
jgi:hypothetical protein